MAVVMAWMLLTPIHGRAAMCLVVAFALGAVWFAVVAVRHYVLEGRGRLAQTAGHAVSCAAMTFMLLPMSGETLLPARGLGPMIAPDRETTVRTASAHGMAMATTSMPGVTTTSSHWWVLTVLLLAGVLTAAAWTLRSAWAQWRAHRRSRSAGQFALVAAGSRLAMSSAMAYMLVCLLRN